MKYIVQMNIKKNDFEQKSTFKIHEFNSNLFT